MAQDTGTVFIKVAHALIKVDNDRAASESETDFQDVKDGMLYMHQAWQQLMASVRNRRNMNELTDAAINLAAVSVKFVSDLGCSADVLEPAESD